MGPPRAPRSTTFLPLGLVRELGLSSLSGYLQAVCPELFGPVFPGFGPAFLGFSAESDPGDPLRSPGPSPHINFHEKSSRQTDSKAMSWHLKNTARRPSTGGLLWNRGFWGSGRPGWAWKPAHFFEGFLNWGPEGSLAGSFARRHLASELACGADFSRKLMLGAGPAI